MSPFRAERNWSCIASSVPVGPGDVQALRNIFNAATSSETSVQIHPKFLEALLDIFNTFRATLFFITSKLFGSEDPDLELYFLNVALYRIDNSITVK